MRGKKIKIINNKEILKELDKAASLKEIDLFDENYKIDLTNSYDNIEILVNKSLTVLKENSPWIYQLYKLFDIAFYPAERKMHTEGSSSSPQMFGFICFTFYDRKDFELNIVMLASTIAHELAHHVLSMWQFFDEIIKNKGIETYSPIRKTNRPIISSFHALISASFIISAVLDYRTKNKTAIDSLNNYSKDLIKNMNISLKEIKEKADFTELGFQIYNEIQENIEKYNIHIY